MNRLETKRWEYLELHMPLLDKAQRVDHFLEAYRKVEADHEVPPDCAEFLIWVEEQRRALNAAISPEEIFAGSTLQVHK